MSDDLFAPGSIAVPAAVPGRIECDIVIVGSGMGGGTLAWALRGSGARVLLVERGDFLPREAANASPTAVFGQRRYATAETWLDGRSGRPFHPGVHYWVGGNTKVYGACLPRFRSEDFGEIDHAEGVSAAWPVTYEDLEPHYTSAERVYAVHGAPGDPTDPPRSTPFPWPALEHEPEIDRLARALAAQGLTPFHMPQGVDLRDGGSCIRCRTCDGFPCPYDAKSDAETRAVRPALREEVRLLTRTRVTRLETSPDGSRVSVVRAVRDGSAVTIAADRVVLAAGAVNSAALLLGSASPAHPRGLANSSGLVGRRYMVHNSTFMIAVDPRRRNPTSFQKTLGVNDWYRAGPGTPHPLGNLQMLGKLQGPMVAPARPWVPRRVLDAVTARSVDVYLTTEDLPVTDNRVVLAPDGRIVVHWRPTNLAPHRELVRRAARALRRAGYPVVLTQRMGIGTNSHQCGTAVMSTAPGDGVVTPDGRAHDVENLWLADASVFPSSAAVNPALTIAALALRLADRAAWTAPRERATDSGAVT